jgi:hypothetical protein
MVATILPIVWFGGEQEILVSLYICGFFIHPGPLFVPVHQRQKKQPYFSIFVFVNNGLSTYITYIKLNH